MIPIEGLIPAFAEWPFAGILGSKWTARTGIGETRHWVEFPKKYYFSRKGTVTIDR
jgi:hypothetical protein